MTALIGPSPHRAKTITVITSVDIPRPAETIWPYLVDWERLDRWMLEASDFAVLGDTREGEGTEVEATIRIGGLATRDRIRVTRWEPPWALEIAHLGWVQGTGYMELGPGEQGTEIFWREEFRPPWGLIGRLGMRALRPVMQRIFQRDLFELRSVVLRDTDPWRTPG